MKFRNTSFRLSLALLIPAMSALTWQAHAQDAPKLSKQALQLQTDVKTLAADAMEGRKVGTKGEKKASEYLVKRFKEMGVQGAISDSKMPYFDPFEAQPSVHGTPTGPKITGRNVVAVAVGSLPHADADMATTPSNTAPTSGDRFMIERVERTGDNLVLDGRSEVAGPTR